MKSQISALFSAIDQLPPDEVVQDIRINDACLICHSVSGKQTIVNNMAEVTIVTLMPVSGELVLNREYAVHDGEPVLIWQEEA